MMEFTSNEIAIWLLQNIKIIFPQFSILETIKNDDDIYFYYERTWSAAFMVFRFQVRFCFTRESVNENRCSAKQKCF